MSNAITAISLIAYDYELLLKSLPSYIHLVDEVILGLDIQRLTWAGNSFAIPDRFFSDLKKIDPEKKIKIVEYKFFIDGQSARALDTRERNILSTHTADGSWLLSIDADEIMLNAAELVRFLRNYADDNICIFGNWITLFKQDGDKLFVIENSPEAVERFPLATKKKNAFTYCRNTEQKTVLSAACALHFSWARTRDELEKKLLNWTHRDDFVVQDFLAKWDSVDELTAPNFIDFHPFEPKMWQSLVMVKESELEAFAHKKNNEFNSDQGWSAVISQARVKLLEDKILKRDAATLAANTAYEAKIASLEQQVTNALTVSKPVQSTNFLSNLFKSKP